MWMHGEQEQNSTQTSDYLPNADETWYLQATLDVEAGKEAGLACCVKHSSLGEQNKICHSRKEKKNLYPGLRASRGTIQAWSEN